MSNDLANRGGDRPRGTGAQVLDRSRVTGLAQESAWIDLGLGFGVAGEGGGGMGRAAIGFSTAGDWAFAFRGMGQNGGEDDTLGGGFFGPPSEEFTMYDFLVYRVLTRMPDGVWLGGLGVGVMKGQVIDPDAGLDLFSDLDSTIGVPYELIYRSGDGRGLGWALHVSGHLNGEVQQTGLGVSVTLGFGGDPVGDGDDGPG